MQKLKRKADYCESCQKPLYKNVYTTCKECRLDKGCTKCGSSIFRRGMCRSHYDKDRFATRPRCSEYDCKENAKHNGLCSVHYNANKLKQAPECSISGCTKKVEKKGLCGTHYQAWRIRQPKKKCSHASCDNNAFKHKLCFSHWKIFDPETAFVRGIRVRITNSINRRYKKNDKAEKLLGLNIEGVRRHLESLFQPGMSWDNFGSWHIDHICPCSQAQNEEELIKLQHYTNLSPMWKDENFAKRDTATEQAIASCSRLLGRGWIGP
jgi:hypothetical protein